MSTSTHTYVYLVKVASLRDLSAMKRNKQAFGAILHTYCRVNRSHWAVISSGGMEFQEYYLSGIPYMTPETAPSIVKFSSEGLEICCEVELTDDQVQQELRETQKSKRRRL